MQFILFFEPFYSFLTNHLTSRSDHFNPLTSRSDHFNRLTKNPRFFYIYLHISKKSCTFAPELSIGVLAHLARV